MIIVDLFSPISRRFCSAATRISDLLNCDTPKENVAIQGWVSGVHKLGKQFFAKIIDGTMPILALQAVIPRSICPKINNGSAVELVGNWKPSPGRQQKMELQVARCLLLGLDNENVIMHHSLTDTDLLRRFHHLRAKSPHFASLLRLRSKLLASTHKFFQEKLFCHYDPPIISANDCEGAGETFEVKGCTDSDFLGDESYYLSVSSQLYLESAILGIPNVYTIVPAFRADKSMTSQHLAEFRMLEVECAFKWDLESICLIVEEYIEFVIQELSICNNELIGCKPLCSPTDESTACEVLIKNFRRPIPKITYHDAISLLSTSQQFDTSTKRGLNKQMEFELVKKFKGPVFVLRYPSSQKPFYMRRPPNEDYAECFDLLVPFVGELCGGSVREWEMEHLLHHSDSHNPALKWYLDLRNSGYPRSSGFGLGIERFMQALFGIANIRDTIPFPRWFKHCKY